MRVGAEQIYELNNVIAVCDRGNLEHHRFGAQVEQSHRIGCIRIGRDHFFESVIEGNRLSRKGVDRAAIGGDAGHQKGGKGKSIAHQHRKGVGIGLLGSFSDFFGGKLLMIRSFLLFYLNTRVR